MGLGTREQGWEGTGDCGQRDYMGIVNWRIRNWGFKNSLAERVVEADALTIFKQYKDHVSCRAVSCRE